MILVIGANPTDAHPVFASRMKRRLREGAKLIVIDPRRIDLVRIAARRGRLSPAAQPGHQRRGDQRAGARRSSTEGLVDEAFVAERCDAAEFAAVARLRRASRSNSPEAVEAITGVPAADVRAAARLYATGGNAAIYYGLGVTEHSQGSTMVMGMANLAMATGNIGRDGVGVNPLRGQNNVQGSCDMGSFPHEFSGYRHVSDDATRALFEEAWGVGLDAEPGLRIPNMLDAAIDGTFKGLYIQGEDIAQSDPNTQHVTAGLGGDGMRRRPGPVPQRDRQLRPRLPAGLVLPGEGRHLHQRRAPHQPRAQGDAADGRHGRLGSHDGRSPTRMGYPMNYDHPSEIMDEIARLTPTFAGRQLRRSSTSWASIQWPCNDSGAGRHADHARSTASCAARASS